jgi:hypothetical protein
MAPADFSLNVVLNAERRVVRAFAGDMLAAHAEACRFVSNCACPVVERQADVVLTSSGGYPLDATFYQCVKGFVSCLPAVAAGGAIIAFGGCSEGIGSPEYAGLMKRYAGRWQGFLADIADPDVFTRDQWQLQMHCRALAKVGQEALHFVTDGLAAADLAAMSVNPHAVDAGGAGEGIQTLLDGLLPRKGRLAVLPEGPYCAPVAAEDGR